MNKKNIFITAFIIVFILSSMSFAHSNKNTTEIHLEDVFIHEDELQFSITDISIINDNIKFDLKADHIGSESVEFTIPPVINSNDNTKYNITDNYLNMETNIDTSISDSIQLHVPSLLIEKSIDRIQESIDNNNDQLNYTIKYMGKDWLNLTQIVLKDNKIGIPFKLMSGENYYPGRVFAVINGEKFESSTITIFDQYGNVDRGCMFIDLPDSFNYSEFSFEILIESIVEKNDGNWNITIPIK